MGCVLLRRHVFHLESVSCTELLESDLSALKVRPCTALDPAVDTEYIT